MNPVATRARVEPSAEQFFLPASYVCRPRPAYFEDEDSSGRTWQPHVYPLAAALARRAGATHIIDVGCGRARKLVDLQPEFAVIGMDYGSNLEYCRAQHPHGTWIEVDLERPWPSLFDDRLLGRSVIVCSDVIEHLIDPTALLNVLARLGAHAQATLVSTPERARTWGPRHLGPPPNTAHVREWTLDELAALAAHHGLLLSFAGVTASEDATLALNTSLLVAGPRHLSNDRRRALGEFTRDTLQDLYDAASRDGGRQASDRAPKAP